MAASLRSDLLILWGHVLPRRRRQLLLVALLMPATALAEFAMIAALVPFLTLLADRSARSYGVGWLDSLQRSAITVAGSPLLATAMLFIAAAAVTAVLRLLLAWQSERFAYGLGHELAVETQRRLLHQPYRQRNRRDGCRCGGTGR